MIYQDRSEAGRRLAEKLAAYANRPDVLVLALPRGGVPVAYKVATRLHLPLDVFIVRKLGIPGYEELAMGAIASGGIRVIGEDHKILNNYIDGVEQGGIWITSGIVNSPLKGYFQAKNISIASNTIVDCHGPCLELDAGIGRSGRTLRPQNVTIRKNLFSVPGRGALIKGKEGAGFKWRGNIAASNGAGASTITPEVRRQTGIRLMEIEPERGRYGLWQPNTDPAQLGSPPRCRGTWTWASSAREGRPPLPRFPRPWRANSAMDDDVPKAKKTGAGIDDRARAISQRERVQVRARSDAEIGDDERVRDRQSIRLLGSLQMGLDII